MLNSGSAARSAVQDAGSGGGLAATIFASSAQKGGDFANGVIGTIARGDIRSMGTMKGAQASRALTSYMGFAGLEDAPTYTNVEIGGGRISGIETNSENPEVECYNPSLTAKKRRNPLKTQRIAPFFVI